MQAREVLSAKIKTAAALFQPTLSRLFRDEVRMGYTVCRSQPRLSEC
ncbi:hypothetical protein AB4Y95_03105 [Arthrobacter sp. M-10]